jgi:O-antigen/teichoic acid export membrane protein
MQGDGERLARGYLAALSLVFLLVAPVFAFLGWHAEEVVQLLYGHKWAGAGPLFAVFCAAVPCLAMLAITGPLLRAVGAVRAELLIQLLMLGAMVGGLSLLSRHPLSDVAWLIPALALARVLLACGVLSRHVGVSWHDFGHALAAGAAFALLVLASCAALRMLLPALPLLAAALTVLLVPLLCLLILRLGHAGLLAPQLRMLLLGRAAESKLLAQACRVLGLRREAR